MALTVMMQQYFDIKENYKDAILFYRLGDFYEMFFDDAINVSKFLDLTLTGRDCGLEQRAPMCGIPYHAAENYIAKLVAGGFKVAICEQVGEIVPNKLTKREVVRVITPGTVVEESMLDNSKNNYICAIYLNKKQKNANNFKENAINWENSDKLAEDVNSIESVGIAVSDISTGEFKVEEIKAEGKKALLELNIALNRVLPTEIITSEEDKKILKNSGVFSQGILPQISQYYDYAFNSKSCDEALKNQFNVDMLKENDLTKETAKKISAGALLIYIADTQKRSLAQINKISNIKEKNYLKLDVNTRRNLEITETLRERKKRGSLLWVLDNTSTNMGSRLLRNWISEPLQDEKEINLRLDAVEELISNIFARDQLKDNFKSITDMERIASRVAYGNFTPRDAVSLMKSTQILPFVKELLTKYSCKKLINLQTYLDELTDIKDLLEKSINPDCPALLKDGVVIKEGYSKELDEYRNAKSIADDLIIKLEEKEKAETGIKNLKINFNRVFGYFIEVSKMQTGLVPFRYVRKQTTTNSERYITDELKVIEDKVLGSSENASKLQQELFNAIRSYLLTNLQRIQKSAQVIAELDCLLSLANVAVDNNYCKPKVSSKLDHIKIVAGRHPVVEKILKNNTFVSNDTFINTSTDKSLIITGPNMAGKSTYMRQIALITLLAHLGSYVPATSAEICITDQIFTRVGASDDLSFGQSTFMVEMSEVANILHNATDKSLVILDEVGRGTSTFDGLAIAWAVMEYISNKMNLKTIFSTHYHELTELEGFLRGVKNYRITVKEIGDEVAFLRKVVRGGANKSFGIAVASLAGLPREIITRAKEISINLENSEINKKIAQTNLGETTEVEEIKRSYNEVIGMLEDVNVNMLTPLGAFDLLVNLVEKVKK